jgi:hypothetical protein
MQVTAQHILKHSKDDLTSSLAFLSRVKAKQSKSKRWEPGVALDIFESQLDFSIRYGGQTGKRGLGFDQNKISHHATLRERRKEIGKLCKAESADARLLKLHGLARSGDFLKWDNMMGNQIDWNTQILQMSKEELAFSLNGQALSLPSPSNLRRWGFNPIARCLLCNKFSADAAHMLAGCPVVLNQGRSTYRHDNVLRSILHDLRGIVAIASKRQIIRSIVPKIGKSFIKSGQKKTITPPTKGASRSLLHLANDWDFQIDLDGSFKWPIPNVVATDLRPDIVFVSNNMRIIIWGELTAPMERRISISAIIKKKRYIDLKARLMSKGWTVYDMTLEVGALGFTSTSVADFLTKLGFPQMQKKFMIKRMCVTALRSSFYIWNARHSLTWNPPILSNASATPFPKSDCWNDLATKPSAAKVFLAKISLNMSQKH